MNAWGGGGLGVRQNLKSLAGNFHLPLLLRRSVTRQLKI